MWLAIGLQLYWKIVSGTGVFQLVLRNLIAHLFSQNTSGGCFWISKKMLLQTFSVTPKWIYNIHKKIQKIYCKRFERIPCLFSSNIFNYDWIPYGTSSSSIDTNKLFHFICGWLVGTSNGTRMTFSSTTWQKTEAHWKFLSLTLLTKGRNKTLKWLLLLTICWKYKELKLVPGLIWVLQNL